MKSQVWLHKLNNHFEIKEKLLESIEKSKQTRFDDGTDLISFTDFYDKRELDTKPYFSIFHNNANDFYDELVKFYCIKEFNIRNGWFQQYFKNDKHQWHYHGGTNISFVYFIELKNKQESTEFYDLINKDVFQMNVSEGDILTFPAYMPHRSPVIKSNNRKTIISCNINMTGVDTSLMSIDK